MRLEIFWDMQLQFLRRISDQMPRSRSASRVGVAGSLESLPSYSNPTR
jgi:hypothetical protein